MKPLDDLFEKSAAEPGSPAPAAPPASPFAGATSAAINFMTGPTVGGPVSTGVSRLLAPASTDKLRTEVVQELFDPQYEASLAKIKTQAMLSEFLSVDPVISAYDPEEVTAAYNQIAQMAPRASQQPSVMRGLLRKMLQQQDAMEPFESEQLTKIEESLKRLSEPAERLMTPPES